MSSARTLQAMVCANYSLHLFFSSKRLLGQVIVFHLHMDSKTFTNVILTDFSKLSLSFKIKTFKHITMR